MKPNSGPVQWLVLVIRFPGNHVLGDLASRLQSLGERTPGDVSILAVMDQQSQELPRSLPAMEANHSYTHLTDRGDTSQPTRQL